MSDLLSGLLGRGGGLGGGLRMAALALLLHQVMKRSGGAATREEAGGGGGLGGLLGGLLGGGGGMTGGGGLGGLLGGGAAAGGLGGLISGLGGLLGGLRGQGLGQQVDSWVSTGANQPVDPRQIAPAFDADEVDSMARRAGTDRESLLQEVSRILPDFVDRMTPQGRVPDREEEVVGGGGLSGLLGSLLGGGTQADDAPRAGMGAHDGRGAGSGDRR